MRFINLLLLGGVALQGSARGPLPPGSAVGARIQQPAPEFSPNRSDNDDHRTGNAFTPSSPSSLEHVVDAPSRRGLSLKLRVRDASEDEMYLRSEFAYATVLLDDHDRGIRTLGQSLIDSRTGADLVAILAPAVSHATELRIRVQGWRIRRLVADGGAGRGGRPASIDSARESVLAHASAWSLIEYKQVILLEDNMLVLENIDDLFSCSGICAVMQQAEMMSTSLLVLEPNIDAHDDMSQAVGSTYSISNDFQGFLNSYFSGFEKCALFDNENPALRDPSADPSRGPDAILMDHTCHRLPTRYTGDLSLIMLNGGLGMVRTKNEMQEEWWRQRRARVVRFGFAGLRPWMWFAAPFLPFVSMWEDAHFRANPSDPSPNFLGLILAWMAFVGTAMAVRALLARMFWHGCGRSKATTIPKAGGNAVCWTVAWWRRAQLWGKQRRWVSSSGYNPRSLLWSLVHLMVGYSSLALAVTIGVRQVPSASSVWLSWTVLIMWTSTIFGLLWALYLWAIACQTQLSSRPHGSGTPEPAANGALSGLVGGTEAFDPKAGDSGAGIVVKGGSVSPPSPWNESVRSLVLFAALAAFLPSWKSLSGASSLGTLLGPVILALVAMFAGLTVQMVRLPVLWCDRFNFLSMAERDGLYA